MLTALDVDDGSASFALLGQVDLVQASIRPGQPAEWLASLKGNLMAALGSSSGDVTVHCGNWQHDLDQAVMVEPQTTLLVSGQTAVLVVMTLLLSCSLDACLIPDDCSIEECIPFPCCWSVEQHMRPLLCLGSCHLMTAMP